MVRTLRSLGGGATADDICAALPPLGDLASTSGARYSEMSRTTLRQSVRMLLGAMARRDSSDGWHLLSRWRSLHSDLSALKALVRSARLTTPMEVADAIWPQVGELRTFAGVRLVDLSRSAYVAEIARVFWRLKRSDDVQALALDTDTPRRKKHCIGASPFVSHRADSISSSGTVTVRARGDRFIR